MNNMKKNYKELLEEEDWNDLIKGYVGDNSFYDSSGVVDLLKKLDREDIERKYLIIPHFIIGVLEYLGDNKINEECLEELTLSSTEFAYDKIIEGKIIEEYLKEQGININSINFIKNSYVEQEEISYQTFIKNIYNNSIKSELVIKDLLDKYEEELIVGFCKQLISPIIDNFDKVCLYIDIFSKYLEESSLEEIIERTNFTKEEILNKKNEDSLCEFRL